MNNLVPAGSPASPGTLLPVAIDYPAALALRQMALVQDELPKYLLAPEVSALLHYVPGGASEKSPRVSASASLIRAPVFQRVASSILRCKSGT